MEYLIYGALGTLAVLALLALGVFIGWKANTSFRTHSTRAAAEEASEEELRQLKAEQKAFESMLNYNQDTAYGMSKTLEEMVGDNE